MARKKYAKLGEEPKQGQSKKAFILEIDDYTPLNPKDYFITTGEATIKIEVLLNDLKELQNKLRLLQKEFNKIKGESDYLETCWEDGDLILKKKEKRSRSKNDKVNAKPE